MREKLDNFLLGTLWILACALGSCFWFKTMYGFNIFSGAHWRYLGQMQATQTTIKPSFYISLVILVSIAIYGLYLIIRPRLKRLNLPFIRIKKQPTVPSRPSHKNHTVTTQQSAQTHQTPQTTQIIQTPELQTQPTQPEPTAKISENGLARPPRLNIPTAGIMTQTNTPFTAPIMSSTSPVAAAPETSYTPQSAVQHEPQESPELREIFESTGYTIKKAPKISGLQTALFAIGSNESIWVGAIGIETKTLASVLDTINQIFLDTLDDVEIGINGFVVSPADGDNPTTPEILTFDSIDTLRKYMEEHPNPPVRDEDAENFDAFSDYISTVIDYIGKL